MQTRKALFVCILLALICVVCAQDVQSTTEQTGNDGLISYVLTYDSSLTYAALKRKCDNLNCTRIIAGIVNALVVTTDPTALTTLSDDPSLSQSNVNQQVSLNYEVHQNVTAANASTSTNPAWHLDRINQVALPLDGNYESNLTGIGVHIYVIDTGVQADHPEFVSADGSVSRVSAGEWSFDGTTNTADCNGHGTATASLAGGRTVGTSPNATVHAIRAINCQGQANIGDIIAALNYVALNAKRPAVISMSVGTEQISDPLQLAVNNTVTLYNISIIAAAGNAASDSCINTPARSVYVQAVGATDIYDQKATFSNNGKCVNVYAPGVNIYCAGMGSTYQRISGTSMACPIVSGIVGQYLEFNKTLSTWDITDTLYKSRTRGNSPNRAPPIITIPTSRTLLTGDDTTKMCSAGGFV